MLLPFVAVIHVGAGLTFARIEDAVAAARSGDTIEVAAGTYPKTAVRVGVPGLTLRGVGRVLIACEGGDYSGIGSVPRAAIQVEADGCTVSGFEIVGVHNRSHNGAAIRIVAARNAAVADCDLHGNDMGVMSSGVVGDPHGAEGQLFERCHIHHNGDFGEPGQNHNLYLGGTSATLRFCEIDHALTGHDLKSRTHRIRLEHCWLHDAANREIDLVEAWDTERPNSDATLVGCVVQKGTIDLGNRNVIHFGREKGERLGTLSLDHCTVESPFSTPVIALDEGGVARLSDCRILAANPGPVTVRNGKPSPAWRWRGAGRWERATGIFDGAG